MNVLILIKNSLMSGVITNALNITDGLVRHMHDNVVIGSAPGEGTSNIPPDYKVEILNFDSQSPLSIIRTYKKMAGIIKEHRIDVIHAQNRIPALYAAIYCFFHNINYIWANHLVPLSGSFKSRVLTRYGYCAVAEGIEGKDMLINQLRIPPKNVRVINLGIDLSKFKRTSKEQQERLKSEYRIADEKVILLYGRLCDNKGHLFLLDALSKIRNRNFKLIFPGKDDSFKKVVDEKASQYGLTDNIIYPGFVDGPSCLSICDLMVLPSMNEGFPQACVEAYAMGVPVIRSKSGGYEDTKDMCFGVDYGDVDTFAFLLQQFFDKPELYKQKAEIALSKVQILSIENMAEEYHNLYQEAINAKK